MANSRQYTDEELIQRVWDVEEIKKLIHKRVIYIANEMRKEELNDLWVQDPEHQKTASFGRNTGYYTGMDAIHDYYVVHHQKEREKQLKELHAANPAIADIPQNLHIGCLSSHPVSTGLVELAGDGKTAKGLWYAIAQETEAQPDGTGKALWMPEKIAVDFVKEEDGWMHDFEALEKMDLSRVKLMWTNYPNMPTGANATPEIYERLVDFARQKNIVIVNDNPYSFILNDKPISILSVPEAKDCCIEFNSMSKSHNMPGWRIGMLASNAEFVQWILKVKSNIDSGMFRAMQLAAATALEAEADWYEGNNENYRNRRHLAGEIMKTLGCTYDEKQVGMFLWGKIPASCKDVEELTEKVLHEARVFITPGFIFGSNGARYIRISLCCKDNKLAEALERIKRI